MIFMMNPLDMVFSLVSKLVQSSLFSWFFPFVLALFVLSVIFFILRLFVRS